MTAKIKQFKNLIMLVLGVVFLLMVYQNTHVVQTGYTGVLVRLGQIDERPVAHGQLIFTTPFIEDIYQVNNKQQEYETVGKIWGETSDKVAVYATEVSVTYQIAAESSAWICANVNDYEDNLLTDSLIASTVKTAMSELTAEEVKNRAKIEPLVLKKLSESLAGKYGADTVYVRKVLINDMDFEEAYSATLRAKSSVVQEQARAEIENQTAIAKAEADKKVAMLVAEAEAERMRILAKAEADANEVLVESVNGKLIELRKIEKWDGKLPTVMGCNPNELLGDVKK